MLLVILLLLILVHFSYILLYRSCTIQNCVISEKAVIENNCNLNECNIGSGYRVVSGSKFKSESHSLSSSN
jgi:ADP-glucose pyrophosphorylase